MGCRGHHYAITYSAVYITNLVLDRTSVGTFVCMSVCVHEIGPVVLLPDSRLAEWEMKTSEVRAYRVIINNYNSPQGGDI